MFLRRGERRKLAVEALAHRERLISSRGNGKVGSPLKAAKALAGAHEIYSTVHEARRAAWSSLRVGERDRVIEPKVRRIVGLVGTRLHVTT